MDLSLTENQELLKSTAREFMERECPKDVLLEMELSETGVTDQAWQKAAEIGWLGMIVPEEYGGSGSSLTDAAVVFEQLGAGPLSGCHFRNPPQRSRRTLRCLQPSLDVQEYLFRLATATRQARRSRGTLCQPLVPEAWSRRRTWAWGAPSDPPGRTWRPSNGLG